ncbi:MAG: CHASE domain-containing protein [Candidatus Pacebacteria bacterium]|nr:CHASE domain-containing protein [Candidatus Paceibacterota bacterium]
MPFFSFKKILNTYLYSVAILIFLIQLWYLLSYYFFGGQESAANLDTYTVSTFLCISIGLYFFAQYRRIAGIIGLILMVISFLKIIAMFGGLDYQLFDYFLGTNTRSYIPISAILIATAFVSPLIDSKNDSHLPEVTSLTVFFLSIFGWFIYINGGFVSSLVSVKSLQSLIFFILLSLGIFLVYHENSIIKFKKKSQFQIIMVLISTVGIMLAATFVSERFIYNSLQRQFENQTTIIKNEFAERLQLYISVLEGGKGFFNASENVTREEWKTYVDTLDLNTNYPGIQGVGYSEVVSPQDKSDYIRRIRSQGFPNFKIHPEGNRDVYTSIIYLEPFDERNKEAFGYDMFSNEVRRAAMERARDTGEPAMTDGVLLVQEIDDDIQVGFLIYVPYYSTDADLSTVESRRQNLIGYVYSPFRTNDLVEGIFKNFDVGNINFSIYTSNIINEENRLYGKLPDMNPQNDELHRSTSMSIAGKELTLYFTAQSNFGRNFIFNTAPFFILITGLGISLLSTMVFYAIVSSRQRAELYASQLTKDLQKQVTTLKSTINEKDRFSNMFEKAFIHSPIGISIVSLDGKWIRANDELVHTLGYDTDTLTETSIEDITYPKDWLVEEALNQKLINGETNAYQLKKRFIHKKGHEVWTEISVGLVEDSNKEDRFFIMHVRDITTEEGVDQAKTDFVSLASHQMRTPLSSINWFVEMLMDDKKSLTKKQQSYLQQINQSSERMVTLIDNLLNISRVELGTLVFNFKELDTKEIISDIIDAYAKRAKENKIDFKLEISGDQKTIIGDEVYMNIVFDNIIANAVKYAFPETTIDIDVKYFPAHMTVSISNKGYGIPSGEQSQIFSKMYRANNIKAKDSEGFGLGLYLIKKIINQLNGTIDFVSEENETTTFNVTLPYDQE